MTSKTTYSFVAAKARKGKIKEQRALWRELEAHENVRYFYAGEECSDSEYNYEHYHITLQLFEKKGLKYAQNLLGGKYHSVKIKDALMMLHYNRKGGIGHEKCEMTFSRHGEKRCCEFEKLSEIEFGTYLPERSNSAKLEELRERILNGGETWEELVRSIPAEQMSRNARFIKEVFNAREIEPLKIGLLPWQQNLYDRIMEPPCDRKIIWVCDSVGGAGKTLLSRYLVSNNGACYLMGERKDVFYAYQNEKIVIFDLPREELCVDYGLIEKLKDGLLFSGKYGSRTKLRAGNAHVVVFANFLPDFSRLSLDRWEIYEIEGPISVVLPNRAVRNDFQLKKWTFEDLLCFREMSSVYRP